MFLGTLNSACAATPSPVQEKAAKANQSIFDSKSVPFMLSIWSFDIFFLMLMHFFMVLQSADGLIAEVGHATRHHHLHTIANVQRVILIFLMPLPSHATENVRTHSYK